MPPELIGTKAVNSFALQLVKVGAFTGLGVLGWRALGFGLAAGLGAASANWVAKRWLQRLSGRQFRGAVVLMMGVSGLAMIWGQRGMLLEAFG